MTKGKKIAIAVAVVLGVVILVVGTFTKPNATKAQVDPGTFAKNQIQTLTQMQQLTTELYNDEDNTDMAQFKSEITQTGGSIESLYQGMITSLNTAKSQIGTQRYSQILQVLQNKVEPGYKNVINDASEIAKNGYDKTPGQTVTNYQNALKAMTDAQNIIGGQSDTSTQAS